MIDLFFNKTVIGVNQISLLLGVDPVDVVELQVHYGLELLKIRGQYTAKKKYLIDFKKNNQAALAEVMKNKYLPRERYFVTPKLSLTRWENFRR